MDWKTSLDKYLTSEPPNDGFDIWCEVITEKHITKQFFDLHEDWILDNNGQCENWLNELFNRGKLPEDASKIIERAFKLFKLK